MLLTKSTFGYSCVRVSDVYVAHVVCADAGHMWVCVSWEKEDFVLGEYSVVGTGCYCTDEDDRMNHA